MAHTHRSGAEREAGRLTLALALAALTAFIEVAGGALTRSLALLADAAHVWGDAAALLLAVVALRVARRPHTRRWTFGFHRAEVLAAAVNALALLGVGALVAWRAVGRLRAPGDVAGEGVVAVALLGLAANAVQLVLLRHGESLNLRAARLHVVSDLGGSLAALAAGVAVTLFGATRADPLASLLIVALVAVGAVRLLVEATEVLMVRAPAGLDLAAVERALLSVEGVRAVHDVHAWTVSSGFVTFDCHVEVDRGYDATAVVAEASRLLRARFGLEHVTIQPERPPLIEVDSLDGGGR